MAEVIIVQALAILFTLGFVLQQRAAIRMMIRFVPEKQRDGKQFHRGNWLVALVFTGMAVLACGLAGGLAGLWYIALFDPLTIRANWAGRRWWELGSEAWWDRIFIRLFGPRAGYWKLLLTLLLIAVLNVAACHIL